LTIISHASRRLRTRLRVVEKMGEGSPPEIRPKVCSERRTE
jgi:hypothetical protein